MPEAAPLHDPPASYGDPGAEYRAVRDGVGVLDRSALGVVEVTGRDRASFLHAILSNDVKALTPGRGCAAALLDVHGKVQLLLRLWALEDRILVLTPPGQGARAIEDIDRYLFSEKAHLRDATGELALLLLAGPGAPALAERLAAVAPPAEDWSHTPGKVDGVEVRVVRGARETGEPEVWLAASADQASRVWQAAVEGGACPAGRVAYESLRIEAGTPELGREADASVLLPELPLEPFVSYTKGCYVGQEVVVRIRDRGHVNRHLRGLLLEGEAVPPPGAAVVAGDRPVGRVTSAVASLGLRRPVALAFVRREHAEPGSRVGVEVDGATLPATVSALPFPR